MTGWVTLSCPNLLGLHCLQGDTWWVGQRLSAIGLRSRDSGPALAIGAGLTFAAFAVATVLQLFALAPGQSLILRPVDPKTGMTGAAAFVVLLIVGNVFNSFMEEGLFGGSCFHISCNGCDFGAQT